MTANDVVEDLLRRLAESGWRIERNSSKDPLLPDSVSERYPDLPAELVSFLSDLECCMNPEENIWFLCRADYRRTEESAFRWNEYELMSRDAAQKDPERQGDICYFWDHTFPFMMAVHSDYDYLAVSLFPESRGHIIHGFGPEFEDSTSTIAHSFREFLQLYRHAVIERPESGILAYFI